MRTSTDGMRKLQNGNYKYEKKLSSRRYTCEESLICKGKHNLLYCSAQTDLYALYVFGTRIFTDFMSVTFARSPTTTRSCTGSSAMPVQGGR